MKNLTFYIGRHFLVAGEGEVESLLLGGWLARSRSYHWLLGDKLVVGIELFALILEELYQVFEAKVVLVILEVLGGGLQFPKIHPTLVAFVDFSDVVEGKLDQWAAFLPILVGDLQLLC